MIVIDTSMPKNCCECDFRCGLNFLAERPTGKGKHPNCPIVAEIHDECRDLVDRKEVIKLIKHFIKIAERDDRNESKHDMAILLGGIDNIPTILEETE